jgi:hypothetical protein
MKVPSLFCPYCNAKGSKQPVLSPMSVQQVKSAPVESTAVAAPYFHYRCERCGFAEIHDARAADAA